MCRLLLLRCAEGVDPAPHLEHFRALSRGSREYQGHGWGCAWLDDNGGWRLHHDIRPVWEDTSPVFPPTRLFIAHARSAFRDEGIAVENNMPFGDGTRVFAFNGELRGVRIKEAGRIGAEKIFNYIKRFDKDDLGQAVERGVDVIEKRTRYIRAMNFFLADRKHVYVYCRFNEDPEYFQLRRSIMNGVDVVCSDSYDARRFEWQALSDRAIRCIPIV